MNLHFFILTAIVILIPAGATAHTLGTSFEKEVGAYKIDIGYEPAFQQGNDRVVFDFGTFTSADELVDFDYVWVRLEHEKRTLLATGIAHADFGPTSLLFTLPENLRGEIVVHVRYQRDDEALAEASFPLNVTESPDARRQRLLPILVGITMLIVGAIAGIAGTQIFRARRV
jgi:hypothetical protein